MTPILELKNISKSFPGVRALDDVRFDVMRRGRSMPFSARTVLANRH